MGREEAGISIPIEATIGGVEGAGLSYRKERRDALNRPPSASGMLRYTLHIINIVIKFYLW